MLLEKLHLETLSATASKFTKETLIASNRPNQCGISRDTNCLPPLSSSELPYFPSFLFEISPKYILKNIDFLNRKTQILNHERNRNRRANRVSLHRDLDAKENNSGIDEARVFNVENRFQKEENQQDLHVRFSDIVSKASKLNRLFVPLELEAGVSPSRPDPADYNRLMKAYSRTHNVVEVLRLFKEMKKVCLGIPNILCYNTVLNSLVTANHFEKIGPILSEMNSLQVNPNISTFNILVKAYSCCSDQFNLAYEIIDLMVKSGCGPDVTTYSTLITGLCRAGRVAEAYNVLNEMVGESCSPNICTYTPILQALGAKGMLKAANNLMGFMLKTGCPPNVVAYNVLIDGLCKNGQFFEVKMILEESTRMGWKPNSISYNTYMKGLCQVGRVIDAYKLIEVMNKKGLHLTTVSLNILFDCLCQGSKLYEARSLLESSFMLEWEVSVVNYNTVMTGFCNIYGWKVVLKLLADMFKKGILPNNRTYNIVIHSLCKAKKLREAGSILIRGGFGADIVTYNILIDAFYHAGKIYEVQWLFKRMWEDKIIPDMFTQTIIINRLCKEGKHIEATELLKESMGMGVLPDLVAYSSLIDGLAKSGLLSKSVEWLKRMLHQGLVPNVALIDSIIRGFCKKGYCDSEKIHCVCIVVDELIKKR